MKDDDSRRKKAMTTFGFGLCKISNDDMHEVIRNAIETGYRHFDGDNTLGQMS